MDLNLYHVFVQVYESNTLAIAAERLHITQSAVSHALKRLRQSFADELFVKEGRKLVPTAFARQLYPKVKQGVTLLSNASQEADIDTLIGQLQAVTIAMNDEIELLLLPLIQSWLQAESARKSANICLNSVRLERRKVIRQLKLGKVNVAIDVNRVVADELFQMPLLVDRFVVLTNEGQQTNEATATKVGSSGDDSGYHTGYQHSGSTGLIDSQPMSKEAYLTAKHITVSSRPTGKSVEDIRLSQLGYHRHIAVRCQRYDSAVRLLQNSQQTFLLTLPQSLVNCFYTEGLVEKALPIDISELSLHLYWHQDMNDNLLNTWIRKAVYQAINEQ